jgi:hypothetical protein
MSGRFSVTDLQDKLAEELKKLYKDYPLYSPVNSEYIYGINVYKQYLPESEEDIDSEFATVPYVQIILNSGVSVHDSSKKSTANVVFVFATCDRNYNRQGYRDLMSLIQRLIQWLSEKPLLDNFDLSEDIEWAIGEEDTYPYYFGAVSTTFALPTLERTDVEALC